MAIIVQWANPVYPPVPPVPPEKGGALRSQPPWPCLWPLRSGDLSTQAARSLISLAQIDHRARRLLEGGNGPHTGHRVLGHSGRGLARLIRVRQDRERIVMGISLHRSSSGQPNWSVINRQALVVPSTAPGGTVPQLDPFLARCRRDNSLLDVPATEWGSLLRDAIESPGGSIGLQKLLAALESDPDTAIPGE